MSLRAQRGNLPEGKPHYKTHARYFCTCVEKKAHTSKRVSVIACDNVISKAKLCDAILAVLGKLNIKNSDFLGAGDPKRYFRTFGEKEYASKRQAIVACDD